MDPKNSLLVKFFSSKKGQDMMKRVRHQTAMKGKYYGETAPAGGLVRRLPTAGAPMRRRQRGMSMFLNPLGDDANA
jgi:hypothetical protein